MDKDGPGLPCSNQSMNNPRQETQSDRESRLRYFEKNKEFILETLHYETTGDCLSEENRLRLTEYLDIESDDDGSG